MPRRGQTAKRDVLPDPLYNSKMVTRLINNIMYDGKKGVAQKIVYGAFDIVREKTGKEPLEAFEQALEIEDSMPTRYIAYARALEKLGKDKLAISALEKAAELDERPQILRSLGALYLKVEDLEKAKEIKDKLESLKDDRRALKQNRISNKSISTKKITM